MMEKRYLKQTRHHRYMELLSRALVALLLCVARTFCATLVEGIVRNISVKSFRIWTSGSGDVIQRY